MMIGGAAAISAPFSSLFSLSGLLIERCPSVRRHAILPGDNYVTEGDTPLGYWWRYQHPDNQPAVEIETAICVGFQIADAEARKTYLVARAACGVDAIYVFAATIPKCAIPPSISWLNRPRRRPHSPPRPPQRHPALIFPERRGAPVCARRKLRAEAATRTTDRGRT
jgi:hypothetical protein